MRRLSLVAGRLDPVESDSGREPAFVGLWLWQEAFEPCVLVEFLVQEALSGVDLVRAMSLVLLLRSL